MRRRQNEPPSNGSAFHTPIHGCVERPVRGAAHDVLPRASRSCSHSPAAAGTEARGPDGHQQIGNTAPGSEPEWGPEPQPERVERSTLAVSVHANAGHDSGLAPPNKFDDVRWFATARLTKHVDGCPCEPVDGTCEPLRGFDPWVGLGCRVYTTVADVSACHGHREAQVWRFLRSGRATSPSGFAAQAFRVRLSRAAGGDDPVPPRRPCCPGAGRQPAAALRRDSDHWTRL